MKTYIAILLCTGSLVALPETTEIKEKAQRFINTFSACHDVLSNCADYGQSACTTYQEWASENCKSTCNLCPGGTGGTPQTGGGFSSACIDRLSTCNLFDPSACSVFKQWATDNCARTCNLCSSGGSGTGNGGTNTGTTSTSMTSGTGSGTGSGGTMTGCAVAYRVFKEGESWKDRCKYKCTCVDGASGKVECRQLCFNWNLPAVCHMDPPTPGNCCPKPSCPSNYPLNYPPGYTEE